MNRTGALLFLGLTTGAFVAAGAIGCSSSTTPAGTGGKTTTTSSSSTTTSSGAGGSTTSSSSSTSTSTSSSTSTSTSSSTSSTSTSTSSSSGALPLTCAAYCGEMMANCTKAAGNEQYTSNDICMAVCAAFPVGTLADTSGDTLGCRLYHGGAAGAGASAALTHCPHAGPSGGDPNPNGTAGVCGEPCTAFCQIAQAVCTGANQQFATTAACMTACQSFPAGSAPYEDSDTSGNTMQCRFYHVSAASVSATAAATHCPHIVVASAVCQ